MNTVEQWGADMHPMTPKQRVLAAIAHHEPDRVPIDYAANPGIDGRLKQHFGLQPGDDDGLRRALDVDFRRIGAPYKGPKLHADPEKPGKSKCLSAFTSQLLRMAGHEIRILLIKGIG